MDKLSEHQLLLDDLDCFQSHVCECLNIPSDVLCAILKDLNDIRLKVVADKLKDIRK